MRRRARSDENGAAAVELALLLPLLILLAYGVMEFGMVFAQDLGVGNGAREGARFAVTDPALPCNSATIGEDDVIARTLSAAQTTFFDPDNLDNPASLNIDVYRGQDASSARGAGSICAYNGAAPNLIVDSSPSCDGSSPGDRIYVDLRWQRGLSIPFGPSRNLELPGTGVFQCEYS